MKNSGLKRSLGSSWGGGSPDVQRKGYSIFVLDFTLISRSGFQKILCIKRHDSRREMHWKEEVDQEGRERGTREGHG